jgi:hypothetical protein
VCFQEFCIHSSTDHAGLEEVMMEDEREEIRELAVRFKAGKHRHPKQH